MTALDFLLGCAIGWCIRDAFVWRHDRRLRETRREFSSTLHLFEAVAAQRVPAHAAFAILCEDLASGPVTPSK